MKNKVILKPTCCARSKVRIKSVHQAQQIFGQNVVEIIFKRRTSLPRPKTVGHMSEYRRMLCTSNWEFVNNLFTRGIFGWKKPRLRIPAHWYRNRNLIIVWDFISRDFRRVSLDDCEVVEATPLRCLPDRARFLTFYTEKIAPLSKTAKKMFSDQ